MSEEITAKGNTTDMIEPFRGDDARVAYPLFHGEYGGSIPTSPLHLHFERCPLRRALQFNSLWHSRLPRLPFSTVVRKHGFAYWAVAGNVVYAVAVWSTPVARMLDDGTLVELRRMAIAPDAPRNTASRMLGWMLRELKSEGRYRMAISYQDTEAHTGGIYRAAGWSPANTSRTGIGWARSGVSDRWKGRGASNMEQSAAPKVRWEYALTRVAA